MRTSPRGRESSANYERRRNLVADGIPRRGRRSTRRVFGMVAGVRHAACHQLLSLANSGTVTYPRPPTALTLTYALCPDTFDLAFALCLLPFDLRVFSRSKDREGDESEPDAEARGS